MEKNTITESTQTVSSERGANLGWAVGCIEAHKCGGVTGASSFGAVLASGIAISYQFGSTLIYSLPFPLQLSVLGIGFATSYLGGAHYSGTSAEEKCRKEGEKLAQENQPEEVIREQCSKIGVQEGYKYGVLVGALTALAPLLSIFMLDRISSFFSGDISSYQEKHGEIAQDPSDFYSRDLGGSSNNSDPVE
ncbi:MAG: hypothetical protein SFT93_00360 [Rickettsiaceae bacterium]|nr:hypothetical protein [Rickettsiaceae bacterium]